MKRAAKKTKIRIASPESIPIQLKNMKVIHRTRRGCSGGAMVLGKLPLPGRPANLD